MIQEAIGRLVEGQNLTKDEITSSLDEIVGGKATQAQIAGLLVALRGKGETVEEIVEFASAFRRYSLRIGPVVSGRLVDTCGTGGDKLKTFNVSTVAAVVAAGAGAKVAKHGNRSVTSKCGSADLLESLGFNLGMEPNSVKESIEKAGIGFMFAPSFHPAMKQVVPVRRELGIRTVFNLMGPLINPAGAGAQLLGVYSSSLTEPMAAALKMLGTEEAMVIHGLSGMDEISVSSKTRVSWLKDGIVRTEDYSPKDFGVSSHPSDSVQVSSVEESRRLTIEMLTGASPTPKAGEDAKLDMVLANASAALIVSGLASDFPDAVRMAIESIRSGAAFGKLGDLIRYSGGTLKGVEINATGH